MPSQLSMIENETTVSVYTTKESSLKPRLMGIIVQIVLFKSVQ